ncbi:MAG: DNA polymerase domain-containing protein [Candidatus Bathyarchaeia archaeon]
MKQTLGWLLDVNVAGSEAILWLKTENNDIIRLIDKYRPSFYIKPKEDSEIKRLAAVLANHPNVVDVKSSSKYTSLTSGKTRVLRVYVDSTRNYRKVLRDVEKDSSVEAPFNVDLLHVQWYLFYKDLPPTSMMRVSFNERNELTLLEVIDDSLEVQPPPFTSIIFDIEISSEKLTPDVNVDPISKIDILNEQMEIIKLFEGNERDLLLDFSEYIRDLNPDFLISESVDEKLTYILERARTIGLNLEVGRENVDILKLKKLLPYAHKGRVPLDLETFLSIGIAGVTELSRFSLVPPGLAAKWPAGKIIDSRQCYEAIKRGIIIPQSRAFFQYVKTAKEVIFSDRGALILSPKTGLHENVGVLDFESMFPHIIVKYNVSYETTSPNCIRTDKEGFLPQLTKGHLERRLYFKHLKKKFPENSQEWLWCEQRQRALKRILVCIYGYSGCFANRFNNVLCYEEINRIARETLVNAMNIAMQEAFEVVYADSDSLFVKKKGALREDFENLARKISEKTGLPIALDKHFKFLVLLKQEADPNLDATRRYFGKLTNGELFYRGIELRRHDYPVFIKKFETKLMEILFDAETARDIWEKQYKKALNYVFEACDLIREGKVPLNELIISKSLRRPVNRYRSLLPHVVAAIRLIQMGKRLKSSEVINFLYMNAEHRNPFRRVTPIEVLDSCSQRYDRNKYIEIILGVAETILGTFGFDRKSLEFGITEKLYRRIKAQELKIEGV